MTEFDDNLSKALRSLEEAQKRAQEVAQEALKEGFEQFFEKYPFLGAITWTQYTPYFNDGDPCYFTTNAGDAAFASVVDLEDDESTEPYENAPDFDSKSSEENWLGYNAATRRYNREPNPSHDPQYSECEREVRQFLGRIPDDVYERVFGDHVQVIVTRDGIEVDEYSHE